MSAGSDPDNLVFGIRADRSQLGPDLRAAADQVKREVAQANASAQTAMNREPLRPRFSVDEQDIRFRMAAAIRSMRAQAREANINVEVQTRLFGDPAADARNFRDAMKEARGAIDGSTESAFRLGKALLIAHAAAKALEVVADSIDFTKAFASGDLAQREAAAEELKKTVTALPAAGQAGSAFGRITDNLGIFDVSGVSTLRKGVARLAGTQTDAEMKVFDAQQAELKKKMDETDALIKRGAAQRDAAVAITRAVQREVAKEGKTVTERAVMDAQNRLADFNEALGNRPAGSKTTPEDIAARGALEGQVKSAEGADAQAKIDRLKTGVREVINISGSAFDQFSRRVTEGAEAQIRSQSELRATQLENIGDVDGAEKERFEERVRRQLADAQKIGDFQVDIVNMVAGAEREQLERTQAARRAAKEREAADFQSRMEDEAEAVHRQMADEERARRRQIENLEGSAQDKRLRRLGLSDQADVNEVLRKVKQDVADVDRNAQATEADKDRERKAIFENAAEDIRSITGAAANQQRFEVLSGQQVRSTAFGTGAQSDAKELNTTQKTALGYLKIIADKVGIAIAG